MALAFDLVLVPLVLAAALGAVAMRDLFGGAVLFVVYGLLLAITWVRLGAIDVALAEAAIGAGLTGMLLIGAIARLRGAAEEPPPPRPLRAAAAVLCAAVSAGLGAAVLALPPASSGLAAAAGAALPAVGLGNPVTGVLLAFRGYDTLLETVVLLLALLGVWSLTPEGMWAGRPGLRQHALAEGVLAWLGRLLPPVGIMVGVHLFWSGADAPGGAFQAGTVLAAVWLLAMMAGLTDAPAIGRVWLRLAVVAGPLVFLGVGVAGMLLTGAFLAYPVALAKPLILAIEAALTFSIAATLGLLVAGAPERPA
jgi:multisubunit Na+/H+ antiporter MnhB subunit